MALLKYNPLRLKDMAIRRATADLFKESTILASISNYHSKHFPFDYKEKFWRGTIEYKLLAEISKLGLPKSLLKPLIDTVRPIGRQIRIWKEFHEKYLHDHCGEVISFDVAILEKLCCNTAGAVDYRQTAEELLRSNDIDIVKRYKLACLYCMEDYIPKLWKELPEEEKKYFFSKKGLYLKSGGLGQEFWWPYIINGQESNLDDLTRSYRRDQITFHQHAFQCAAEKGNKTAAEYFFRKLTHEEKDVSVMSTTRALLKYQYLTRNPSNKVFHNDKFSEVLIYLLSVMAPDQQLQFFQEQPCEIFEWLLVWPLHDIFSDNAGLSRDFLPLRHYNDLMWRLNVYFIDSGDYCLKLFQDFFNCIPSDSWISFVDQQCEFDSYFAGILNSQDIKALEIFFRCVNSAARAKLVISTLALEYFYFFIMWDRWDILEMCLREASLSEEDRERLKGAFTNYLKIFGEGSMKLQTREWSRFIQLLYKTKDSSKRCSQVQTPTVEKKRDN